MDAVKDEDVALIARLGAAWIAGTVPNQPIRMRSDNLASSLGEEIYGECGGALAHPRRQQPADGLDGGCQVFTARALATSAGKSICAEGSVMM